MALVHANQAADGKEYIKQIAKAMRDAGVVPEHIDKRMTLHEMVTLHDNGDGTESCTATTLKANIQLISNLAEFCPEAKCLKSHVIVAGVAELDEQECYALSNVDGKGKRNRYHKREGQKVHYIFDKALRINWSKPSRNFAMHQLKEMLREKFGDFVKTNKRGRPSSSIGSSPRPLMSSPPAESITSTIYRPYPGALADNSEIDLSDERDELDDDGLHGDDAGDDDFLQDERELFGDDELSMETVPRPGSLLEQIDSMRRDDEDCQIIAVNEASESEKHRRKGLLTALSQLVRILAPVLMASSFATNLRPMEVRP